MFRVNTKPRRKNAPRIAEKSAPGFLQWLRGRECLFVDVGVIGEGPVEAMHLDFAGGKGVGSKVADRYSVPCRASLHRRQHTRGWASFLREMGTTKEEMLGAADAYWRAWPGRIAWERKLSDG
jgi:hypothetical protein